MATLVWGGKGMRMTVRQISDLLEGEVVGERKYCDDPPTEITGVLRLILRNCSDYMKREGITINPRHHRVRKADAPDTRGCAGGH